MRRYGMVLAAAVLFGASAAAAHAQDAPQTGFEQRAGGSWTTLEEEEAFLAAVAGSPRVRIELMGRSVQGRPMRLVQVGHPGPVPRDKPGGARILLLVCSQHGDEPAGREACLQTLRDLAFTRDPQLVAQLSGWTVLLVPNANPDGSVAGTRGNAEGVDVNRDHLSLRTPEARTVAAVLRDWRPDVVLDLHEFYGARRGAFGGALPVLYDDEVLYLWPRNLNVDPQVYGLSRKLALEYIGPGVEAAGFDSDEYGQYSVGDRDVAQVAGDHDEGIARNMAGLRHSVSVLVESNQEPHLANGPGELASEAERNRRRVAAQRQTVTETLRFLRDHGDAVDRATGGARERKTAEGRDRSAPVFFGGADNDPPEPSETTFPPPCGYVVSHEDMVRLEMTLRLLDMQAQARPDGWYVPMAQPAEPVVPLVLDRRAARHVVDSRPVTDCGVTPAAALLPPACIPAVGFAAVAARPAPGGARIVARVLARRRFTGHVVRQATRDRVIRARVVRRFGPRRVGFRWTGRDDRGRPVPDGHYVLHAVVRLPDGRRDVRSLPLERRGGRFRPGPAYRHRGDCLVLRSFALTRSVFGGRTAQPLEVAYRLARRVRTVRIEVRAGGRRVRALRGPRSPDRVHRLSLPASAFRPGVRVRVTALVDGARRGRVTVAARRL